MTETIAYLREFHFASVVLRLALAMLLGGCIGLERERKRRPAGFRTYMLVCLGAALTVLLSLYEYTLVTGPWSALAAELGMKTDVSRFGAQVINGIGFLGRRGILRMRIDRVCYDLPEHLPVSDRVRLYSGKRTRYQSVSGV